MKVRDRRKRDKMYVELTKSKLFYDETAEGTPSKGKSKNVHPQLTAFAAEALERSAKELKGEEKANDTFLWTYDELDKAEEPSLEYDEENNTLMVSAKNDLGYFSITVDLDWDIQIEILQHIVKVVNKMKSAIESVK